MFPPTEHQKALERAFALQHGRFWFGLPHSMVQITWHPVLRGSSTGEAGGHEPGAVLQAPLQIDHWSPGLP